MRIISGKYRGMVIPSPKEEIVKPTLDRVKENIFNIIQFDVPESECLDLFCGSGALGLECLSRGAKHVDFVDNDKKNCLALEKLLIKLNASDYNIHQIDYYDALKSFKDNGRKFDIIFIDPPFATDLAEIAMQKIFKFNLLSDNGVIIWEHPIETKNIHFTQKVKDSRTYGRIQIDFIAR